MHMYIFCRRRTRQQGKEHIFKEKQRRRLSLFSSKPCTYKALSDQSSPSPTTALTYGLFSLYKGTKCGWKQYILLRQIAQLAIIIKWQWPSSDRCFTTNENCTKSLTVLPFKLHVVFVGHRTSKNNVQGEQAGMGIDVKDFIPVWISLQFFLKVIIWLVCLSISILEAHRSATAIVSVIKLIYLQTNWPQECRTHRCKHLGRVSEHRSGRQASTVFCFWPICSPTR